jgi:hypothetical protein
MARTLTSTERVLRFPQARNCKGSNEYSGCSLPALVSPVNGALLFGTIKEELTRSVFGFGVSTSCQLLELAPFLCHVSDFPLTGRVGISLAAHCFYFFGRDNLSGIPKRIVNERQGIGDVLIAQRQ